MKKIFSIIALALALAPMGASAQTETTTWDFKTPTEADKTNLDADKTDWEVYSSTRFRNKSVISEPTELTANGD